MVLAKPLSKSPKEIAEEIKENFQIDQDITKVEVAGPGFINFFLSKKSHGAGHNQMNNSRPLILFGYRACDAWPLINDGNPHPEVNLENYDKNIIVGNKSIKPRLTKVPTIIPLPKKKHYVSIYELQKN